MNASLVNTLLHVVADRLRAALWRLRGGRLAAKVRIGPRCACSRPDGMELGARVTLETGVLFKIVSPRARLRVGDHSFLGPYCVLDVLEEVDIGDHCLLGPGCVVVDHNHGMDPDRDMQGQPCEARPIRIGRDVWCGAHVVVLAGVTIGDGAVVGANAVVTRDIPPGSIAVGNPARVIGMRGERTERRPP